jgi:hypothetical protein
VSSRITRPRVVVVAHHEVPGRAERRQDVGQRPVGGGLALVGQVAAEHAEGGVGVVGVDVGDAGGEPLQRVDPVDLPARGHQVGVADLDDLHGARSPRAVLI